MANDKNQGLFFREEGINTPKVTPAIPIPQNEYKYDISKEMQDMLVGAQKKTEGNGSSTSIKMSEFDFSKSLLASNPIDELLYRVKELMSQEKFEEALKLLVDLYKLDPLLHEAIYLKALCQEKLGQPFEAMVTLHPICNALLNKELEDRVTVLRTKIRNLMLVQIIFLSLLSEAGNADKHVLDTLEQLRYYDPNYPLFYYLLGVSYEKSGQPEKAFDVVCAGLEIASGEGKSQLGDMKGFLEKELLKKYLKPAILSYKKKQYNVAKAELHNIKPEYTRNYLFIEFSNYFDQLTFKGFFSFFSSTKKLPRPTGKPEVVNEMFYLITREQSDKAFELFMEEKYREAEKLFLLIHTYSPYYSANNFATAACMYQRIISEMSSGTKKPDLKKVEDDLTTAQSYIKLAFNYEEKELLDIYTKLINDTLGQIAGIKQDKVIIDRNSTPYLALVNELNSGTIKITSLSQVKEYKEKFTSMKKEAEADKKKLVHPDSIKSMEDLIGVMTETLNQFSKF